jgi:hypothetical protein
MESSWLLTESIDIEQERIELEHSGMHWIDIKKLLVSKYRESSKKSLFQCDCCKATTLLVLNKEKVCHFKHKSAKECAGSRNYTRYASATNKFESFKHRIGKSIIKDQLKSNLSLVGASITDGYLYREELNFIPDIIVEWPSGEVWSFDYVTGTGNPQYQRHLFKKQATYRTKNFKSYFLFDHSQVALKKEQHALALSEAEKGSLQFLQENIVWQGMANTDSKVDFNKTVLIEHIYQNNNLPNNYGNRMKIFENEFFDSFKKITNADIKDTIFSTMKLIASADRSISREEYNILNRVAFELNVDKVILKKELKTLIKELYIL